MIKNNQTNSILFLLVISLFLCVGCDKKQASLAEIKQELEKLQVILPPPENTSPESTITANYQHDTYHQRDPFAQSDNVVKVSQQPDESQRKKILQQIALDSLKMVGTLQQGKQFWALIVSPDGILHRVTCGDYLGRNHGKVVAITAETLQIVETVNDMDSGWENRAMELTIAQDGKS